MPTPRIPTPADAAGIHAAYNDTAAALGLPPRDIPNIAALLTPHLRGRGWRYFWVNDESDIGGPPVAGFLMAEAVPDGKTASVQLMAVARVRDNNSTGIVATARRYRRTFRLLIPEVAAWMLATGRTTWTASTTTWTDPDLDAANQKPLHIVALTIMREMQQANAVVPVSTLEGRMLHWTGTPKQALDGVANLQNSLPSPLDGQGPGVR